MSFADSYLGQLRAAVGQRVLLSVGVRILVEDAQGRFLVIRRADNGKWALPAGGMELGESLMQATERELFEETNLKLHAPTPFGISSDPQVETHVYPNGDPVQTIAFMVHMHGEDFGLRSNDGEVDALEFKSLDEIAKLDFVTIEQPTFAHWQRFVETGVFQVV